MLWCVSVCVRVFVCVCEYVIHLIQYCRRVNVPCTVLSLCAARSDNLIHASLAFIMITMITMMMTER